jgi:hypothetical protein
MNLDDPILRSVEAALLDCDGSCRDINFAENISTSGAIGILELLESSWTLAQAMTGEGDEVPSTVMQSILRQPNGSLSTVWRGGRNPEHIQAYFHWVETDRVFCELTFFPQDFDSQTFTLLGFLSVLRNLAIAARSDEYYLRYEDASWRHGEHEKEGVILSDKVLALSTV